MHDVHAVGRAEQNVAVVGAQGENVVAGDVMAID